MSSFGGYGVPGTGAIQETTPREIFWGGDRAKGLVVTQNGHYSGAIRDAGNSPTTVIRPGLLVGALTSGGKLEEWDGDAADGTENIAGVVAEEFRATDFDGNNSDRALDVVVRAPLKASQLLIQGTALTSHVDEFLARRQLHAMGCQLDDDPQGYKAGAAHRYSAKAASYTVVEADNGTTFVAHTADATFTLPTIHAGLEYEFVRLDDFELAVASAEGDNMIGGNDASGDSITFTTAGEQIGARVKVVSIYANGTLKWLYEIKKVNFSTDDVLASTFAT